MDYGSVVLGKDMDSMKMVADLGSMLLQNCLASRYHGLWKHRPLEVAIAAVLATVS